MNMKVFRDAPIFAHILAEARADANGLGDYDSLEGDGHALE